MLHLSRGKKLFLAFLVLVFGGYLASRFGSLSGAASPQFKEARSQGAVVAQDIVNLSNELGENLGTISRLDREGELGKALALTNELVGKSQEVKKRALDLSAQLERMTGALATIRSQEARGAALESIASRLAIIGRLISYSDYLGQISNILQDRFGGARSRVSVATLVNLVNAEVTAINNFNRQAGQAMDRFDLIVK